MYPEAVAILAAISFGITAIFLKKGYKHSTPIVATLVVLAINTILLWTVSILFVPLEMFFTKAALFFIIGGILAQAIARSFRYISIEKIGPSRTYTIIGASPVFAAIFAISILNEVLTLTLILGTLLVVSGIALLSGEWRNGNYKKTYLIIPITAAILYGLVSTIQKLGLEITPYAIVGATTAVTTAFIVLVVFFFLTNNLKTFKLGKAYPHFIGAGIFNSIAFLSVFEAIRTGNVTVVMPLIGTQPLFVTLLSYIFLKKLEKITWKLVAGVVIIVAGVAIITAF